MLSKEHICTRIHLYNTSIVVLIGGVIGEGFRPDTFQNEKSTTEQDLQSK